MALLAFILVASIGYYLFNASKSDNIAENLQADEKKGPVVLKATPFAARNAKIKIVKRDPIKEIVEKPIDKDQMDKKLDQLAEMEGMAQSLSEEELSELNAYFDEVEGQWEQEISNLLLGEMGLGQKALEEYQSLKENYEEEKLEAFEEFHEYMEEKYGDNYAYNPSDDQESFDNKVNDIYLEKMRTLLGGEENYARYIEIKENFNDGLRRQQDPEKGVIFMDL